MIKKLLINDISEMNAFEQYLNIPVPNGIYVRHLYEPYINLDEEELYNCGTGKKVFKLEKIPRNLLLESNKTSKTLNTNMLYNKSAQMTPYLPIRFYKLIKLCVNFLQYLNTDYKELSEYYLEKSNIQNDWGDLEHLLEYYLCNFDQKFKDITLTQLLNTNTIRNIETFTNQFPNYLFDVYTSNINVYIEPSIDIRAAYYMDKVKKDKKWIT